MDDTTQQLVLGGRYELGAVLGSGGMGTVHAATDRRLDRSVAVKILRPDLAEQPRARRRFETEARAAAQLAHPNVVTVYDSGEDDGTPYLVMERLPGRTFADELAAGAVSVDRARTVGIEMLAALGAAHDAGIVHRDVKPGNVLLTTDGHAKVSDFGIAKTVDDSDQTQTADLVATVGYLAPERLGGEPATPRSDLYSVGVVLYEALSGRRGFTGDSPVAVMLAVERGYIEPLGTIAPAVGTDLAAVVERAMARKPQQRYQSAREMADALAGTTYTEASVDATVPVPAAPFADTMPVDPTPTTDATRPAPTRRVERPHPPTRSRRAPRVVGAVVGAILAVLVVAGLTRGHNDSPRTPTPTTQPTTASLPPGLDRAIQQLEQAVGR